MEKNIKKGGTLFTDLKSQGELVPGKKYREEIAVKNCGEMDFYTRVTIGNKFIDLGGMWSSMLKLHLVGSNWILDEKASHPGRWRFYYSKPVAINETTQNIMDYIMIDPTAMLNKIQFETIKEGENDIITSNYTYQEGEMLLEVQVDAIQTHSAKEAIYQAWGENVLIDSDGNLSLP